MQPGRILGKAYRVERALGAGGVGAVYEVTQVRTGRRYAVKVLLPEIAMREGAATRFRREAEALAAIGHSGIVQIHDFDTEEDGTQFLVMDLLEGEDLAARIARDGALDLPTAMRVLDEVAAALGAAHALGIVHRDLKPANIFLSRRPGSAERATILDFGLVKNVTGESLRLTATGMGVGTPLYMSPEQAKGAEVDLRTDVYSLGCILFEMLTGMAPFTGPTISVVIAKILTEPPPLVSAHARRPVPQLLDEVVCTALAKEPAHRYPSARALLEAARQAAGDSSERALAETAVGSALDTGPRSAVARGPVVDSNAQTGSLPRTRDGGPGQAIPSIRPAPETSASGTRAAGASTTAPTHAQASSQPAQLAPMLWLAAGVTVALAAVGAISLLRGGGPTGEGLAAGRSAAVTVTATEPGRTTETEPETVADVEPETVADVEPETVADVEAVVPDRRAPPRTPRPGRSLDEPLAVTAPAVPEPPAPLAGAPPPGDLTAQARALAAQLPEEQRAALRAHASATVRSYQSQIAANERRIQQYEALIRDVLELRRQTRLLSRGDEPPACDGELRQRLSSGARGDEPTVAAMSSMLESTLDPVCTAFDDWASPPAEVRQRFASVGRTLDHADDMLTRAPAEATPAEVDTVRRALASTRRLHEAQPPTFARYPCRDASIAELATATHVANGWCAEAASQVHRAIDRTCASLSMNEQRLGQSARMLTDRTEAAEQQLRQMIQTLSDMNAQLGAAATQVTASAP